MKNKILLSFLFVAGFYFSYGQQVTYTDLIGTTYSMKNPSMQSHIVHYVFKDSIHVDLPIDGTVMNLSYTLDSDNGATLITMTKIKNNLHEPPTAYVLVKKAEGSNLKMQTSNDKLKHWDLNETDNNTALLIPVGTVSAPATVSLSDTTIYFKEFGWTIKLPSDYKFMDSAKIKADQTSGAKIVEESTGVRANMTSNIDLISAMKNKASTFIANYSISPKINLQTWESTDSASKAIFMETLDKQIPVKNVKTNSILILDGVWFKKCKIDFFLKTVIYHASMLTTFYKGHYLTIVYTYLGEDLEIDDMLNASKFEK
ncbi:MAG TPA: hypothetical protein VK772_11725 [Puia sp.]|jgi:hypothetical protein|nr:hypothetical protein [Puia sp.]